MVRQERRESYVTYWLAWNQFIHELRRLRDQIRELPPGTAADRRLAPDWPTKVTDEQAQQLQDLVDKIWDAELEWRAAADALLLVADPQVEQATNAHIAMTEQKLAPHGKASLITMRTVRRITP